MLQILNMLFYTKQRQKIILIYFKINDFKDYKKVTITELPARSTADFLKFYKTSIF